MSTADIRKQIEYDGNKEKKNRVAYLPDDFTTHLPDKALQWLGKYGITEEERIQHQIGWTDERESLVFTARDVWGNLLLVQFRYMGTGLEIPKYYTRGYPESILWTVQRGDDSGGVLCIVEDYVSAVRVGRTVSASPLWGSGLSLNQICRISDRYERLLIWLDKDKAGHAMKLRVKALPYYKSVSVIVTDLDPKGYNDEQIGKAVGAVP